MAFSAIKLELIVTSPFATISSTVNCPPISALLSTHKSVVVNLLPIAASPIIFASSVTHNSVTINFPSTLASSKVVEPLTIKSPTRFEFSVTHNSPTVSF